MTNPNGRFGVHGGQYIPETLMNAVNIVRDEKVTFLLAVGGGPLVKIHFHTNEPWKVLEYCSTLGEIYDIVVEDMERQSRGLKG